MIEPCHCRVQQSFNLVNVLISKFYTTVIARRMKPSYTHSHQHKIRWCLQARKVSFLQVPLPDNCVMTPVLDGFLPFQYTHKHSSPLRQALHTQIANHHIQRATKSFYCFVLEDFSKVPPSHTKVLPDKYKGLQAT